jgi:HPt (histidine-containing phosphotransfer) domain-containing protein
VPVQHEIAGKMPPLAIDELIERCMGDTGTVKMILNEFERQTAADLIALGQHFASRDMESAAKVAHTLKGASGVVAADRLSGVAAEIERNCRRGDLADAERLMGELKLEVNRCIEYLPAAHAASASSDPAASVL